MRNLHLCFDDPGDLEVPNPECPDSATHTPSPIGYGAFFDWCCEMAKTHVQRRCPTCNRYSVWVERVTCSDCGRRYAPIGDGTPRSHRAVSGFGRCPGAHRAAS